MKYYLIGEFSNKIGKSIQTVRNWDKNGFLKPYHVTQGNRTPKILYCNTMAYYQNPHIEKN